MFRSLARGYYRGLSATVVVFDKSSQKSFESIEDFFEVLEENTQHQIVTVLLGSKSDLDSVVTTDQGLEAAIRLGAIYLEASAKTNESIENIFLVIAAWALRVQDKEEIVLFKSED